MSNFLLSVNVFSLSGLILGITSAILVLILSIYGKTKLHRIWALFNFSVAWWGIGVFFMGMARDASQALYITRISYVGVTFIAVFFYHFSCIFSAVIRKKLIIFAYIQAIFFSLVILFNSIPFISIVKKIDGSSLFYLRSSGLLYDSSLAIWLLLVFFGFIETFIQYLKQPKGIKRNQFLYLFLGFFLGFTGGLTNFLPVYGINFIPLGNFTIPFYCIISTYAILKYKVLDIKIAITRFGIFAVVYSLILGIPFGLVIWQRKWLMHVAGEEWFWIPMIGVAVLATVGPSVYLYIQKRAEDRLLQEQRRYQATLRQASAGMGKIKDLKKLLNMIVSVLTHAVQIEHALIYIHDEAQKQYVLGASKKRSGSSQFIDSIEEKSPLVQYLSNNKGLIIFDEIKQRSQDYKDLVLAQTAQTISFLGGELVVPIFIDQNLIAIIVMGKKESGKIYNQDDIGVFSILANQTALAIENAKFYEDMKLTNEQLFQAEKMATIGTMADGLSHQINNRFHSLGFIAGDALDTIRLNQKEPTLEKMKEVMQELDRAFVRVQENVKQGGEVVQGILKYTRKGEAGFTAIDVEAVFKAALEMVQFKIKTNELNIVREYDAATIPKIKGNFTQLQEVFFNLIDNGYDAMMQRKNEAKEPSYQPTLIVRVLKEDNYAQVIFEDNGMGVKDEDMNKLFTPFFTTKLSSKKGTGLGLYVIKKIVEDNHQGQVQMISKYMHGTQMKLRLPIAIG